MKIKNKLFSLIDIFISIKPSNKLKVIPIIEEQDSKKQLIEHLSNTILNKKYKLNDYYLVNEDYLETINNLQYPQYIYHPNSKIIMNEPYIYKINGVSYEKKLINHNNLNNYYSNENLKKLIVNIKKEKCTQLQLKNEKIIFDLYNNLLLLIYRITHYLGKSNLLKFNQIIKKFTNYLINKDKILNINEITDIIEGLISIWFNLPAKNKKNDLLNNKNNLLILSSLKISIINYFNLIWKNNINSDLSWNNHDPPLFYNYFLNLIKRIDCAY